MKGKLQTKEAKKAAGKQRFGFFISIINELKKVTWPTREDATRLTAIVLAVCVIAGLFLGAFDLAFTELFTKILIPPVGN